MSKANCTKYIFYKQVVKITSYRAKHKTTTLVCVQRFKCLIKYKLNGLSSFSIYVSTHTQKYK